MAGWVTNRPDGAVEAVFEGDRRGGGRTGATGAPRVRAAPTSESVDETSEEPEGLSGFEIR